MKTLRDRLRAGKKLSLDDAGAGATPLRDGQGKSKDEIKAAEKAATAVANAGIARCQEILYAERKHKVLIVLQGMDTAGKDGAIRSLFSGVDPAGLQVESFKAPSAEEAAHDFLWRAHRKVPGTGDIAIFNRSHYEDVLIVRVLDMIDEKECKRRYSHIADFERMLAETGTVIVKIFLHISKDEQRERLQARLDDPEKQWKFDANDIAQRARWNDYQRAYERAIIATNVDHAPWYIVPADSKTHRDLLISTLLLEVLESLKLAYPKPDPKLAKLKIT